MNFCEDLGGQYGVDRVLPWVLVCEGALPLASCVTASTINFMELLYGLNEKIHAKIQDLLAMLGEKDHTACKVPLEQEVVLDVSVLAAFLLLHTLFLSNPLGISPRSPLLAYSGLV